MCEGVLATHWNARLNSYLRLHFTFMLRFDLKLTAEGMKNIPPGLSPNDFKFVVGPNTYKCPHVIATFLSPKIARFYNQDPTIGEYRVQTEDPQQLFPQFLSLGYGSTIVMTDENRPHLLSLARELENDELRFSLLSQIEGYQSVATVRALARSDPRFFEDLSENWISFIASNISDLGLTTLHNIPLSVLIDILGHPSLKIPDEEWLWCFIKSKLDSGREFFQLFQFVHFEHAHHIVCHRFAELADEYPEYLHLSFAATKAKFVRKDGEEPERLEDRWQTPDNCGPIFDRLRELGEGNLHDRKVVTVTAKSNSGTHGSDPKNTLEPSNTRFESVDEPGQWICCDFRDRRVVVSEVDIYTDGPLAFSIVTEGSIDGETWRRFDSFPGIDGDGAVSYLFATVPSAPCRFIRLTQVGPNASGNHRLDIRELLLRGIMVPPL
jgi:hypothetical protein